MIGELLRDDSKRLEPDLLTLTFSANLGGMAEHKTRRITKKEEEAQPFNFPNGLWDEDPTSTVSSQLST